MGIAGLTGTATDDAAALTIGGADAGKFSVSSTTSKGGWTKSSGTLVLTASTAVNANTNIVVTVALAEPASGQAAVSPTIATNFAASSLSSTALTGTNILVKTVPTTTTSSLRATTAAPVVALADTDAASPRNTKHTIDSCCIHCTL